MSTYRRRSLASALALAGALCASSALADELKTKDGSTYRGDLVERVNGDHVSLRLASGEVRAVPWSQIDFGSPPPARRSEFPLYAGAAAIVAGIPITLAGGSVLGAGYAIDDRGAEDGSTAKTFGFVGLASGIALVTLGIVLVATNLSPRPAKDTPSTAALRLTPTGLVF